MIKVNENYSRLRGSYLFSEIAKRVAKYTTEYPSANIIRLGIGDVTRPLCSAVVSAMSDAVLEMGAANSFRGYGPEQGYDFLRNAIAKNDYTDRGIDISPEEVFVSDGAKCDCGNIQELLPLDALIAVCDPVYPVYVDTNVMAGRSGEYDSVLKQYNNIEYLAVSKENSFLPSLPKRRVDALYLCYPNNPTGTVLTKAQLKVFVDYCLENDTLLLFDGAYEAFVTTQNIPRSIYEIDGAKECAIEFRSFSKTAGFTGARCAYTIVPKSLMGQDSLLNKQSFHSMWNRRHTTKFNGVPYYTQRGAQAVYSEPGKQQISADIAYYLNNTKLILTGLKDAGISAYGGVDSPYVWLSCPKGLDSWEFFDLLLTKANVVGTPGAGFGNAGEGYFRLTGFNTLDNTKEAILRIVSNI